MARRKRSTLKQKAKSKSNEFNVVIAPAIIGILTACGITVPLTAVVGGYAIVNFVIRTWFTDKPLDEK